MMYIGGVGVRQDREKGLSMIKRGKERGSKHAK